MEAFRFSSAEKVSNPTVGREDHGNDFLGHVVVVLIDYMPPKTTINGQYYAALMGRLREAIKEKRRGKFAKSVLLLHDNAPAHTARVAQVAIRDCGFEQLNHPAYSPDLAPSDFCFNF